MNSQDVNSMLVADVEQKVKVEKFGLKEKHGDEAFITKLIRQANRSQSVFGMPHANPLISVPNLVPTIFSTLWTNVLSLFGKECLSI